MPVILTALERQTLQAMEQQAISTQIPYWQIYDWLIGVIGNRGVSSTDSALLWLKGAREINASRGAMSELIRSYTAAQYELRRGVGQSPDDLLMQGASNGIVRNLIDDLLGRTNWTQGLVPDIDRIAIADAKVLPKLRSAARSLWCC